MGYPKRKYGKKESVVVMNEAQEKALGDEFKDSPAMVEGCEYDYEGKPASKSEEAPDQVEIMEEKKKPGRPKKDVAA